MPNTHKLHYWHLFIFVPLGIGLRLLASTWGHNYDFDSFRIVADILEQGGNVYASTYRYNYAPVWFNLLHLFDQLARSISLNYPEQAFRTILVLTLSLVDVGIFYLLWRKFSLLAAYVFFFNPISIFISGYHNQFDNLALFLGLLSVVIIGDQFDQPINRRKLAGLAVLGLSLMTKHILFAFPFWLAVKQKGFKHKLVVFFLPIVLFLLSFLPYWAQGQDGILQNVFLNRSFDNAILYSLLTPGILRPIISPGLLWLFFLLVAAFLFRRRSVVHYLLLYTAVLVAASPAITNQYLAIPIPFISVNLNLFSWFYTLLGTLHLLVDGNGLHLQGLQAMIRLHANQYYSILAMLLFVDVGCIAWRELSAADFIHQNFGGFFSTLRSWGMPVWLWLTRKTWIWLTILGVSALGLASYVLGTQVLDMHAVDWLLASPNGARSLIGLQFFLREPWSFPPAQIKDYFYPIGTGLAGSDSLPLLAIPWKLVAASWLGNPTQYFGYWLYIAFLLQACFAFLLMGTATKNRPVKFLAALFFLFSPLMIFRTLDLTMTAQWTILAALWWYFLTREKLSLSRYLLVWFLLAGIATLIHPYSGLMVVLISLAAFARDFALTHQLKLRQFGLFSFIQVLLLLIGFYLTGFITRPALDSDITGLGLHSLNLNSLVNSQYTSHCLAVLSSYGSCQLEGFARLGLGVVVLILYLIGIGVIKWLNSHGEETTSINPGQKIMADLPLLVLCILFFLYSLGGVIAWGDTVLATINLAGNPLAQLADQYFAYTGRFFWPVYYLLIYFVLARLVSKLSVARAVLLLSLCLLIQIADLLILTNAFAETKFRNVLSDPGWSRVVQPFDTIVPIPPFQATIQHALDYRYFSLLAVEMDKKLTAGDVINASAEQVKAQKKIIINQLRKRKPDPNSLYVFSLASYQDFKSFIEGGLICYNLDNYLACHTKAVGSLLPDHEMIP